MKIVCFGDSNTWGFDPRGPFGSRYDLPWPAVLAEKLGCEVLNLGENGREIPKDTVDFPEDMDLLLVMLGTNDLLQFWSPEMACEKIACFLSPLVTCFPGILLIAPPPMVFGEWVQDQELIDDSVELGTRYGDLACCMGIGFVDTREWGIPLAYDGVHLTEEGHLSFADRLSRILKEKFWNK